MSAGRAWRAGLAVAAFAYAFAAVAADVPYLSGRVVDEANLLTPDARKQVTQLSERHEQKTGNQVAVLTMPSLDGESVEGYATRVFEA